MKKVYNKLVRDNIIDIIKADNKECSYRVLNNEDYLAELDKKLVEEVKEYLESHETLELCDILEVLEAIKKAKGIDEEEFNTLKDKKAKKNGGFDKRLFLEYVIEKDE